MCCVVGSVVTIVVGIGSVVAIVVGIGSVVAIVVGIGWSLNLTSAMCTHSITLLISMKYFFVVVVICKGMETLVRDVQFCMSLVRITLPILSYNSVIKVKLKTLMSLAPMPQAGQWNTYSSTSHSTTGVWKPNLSLTLPVLALTVNSGAAHTNSSALFLSEVSMVGTTPLIRTLVVMASAPRVESVQSHVLMPAGSTTHSVGQPPLALDPFTAITPDRVWALGVRKAPE